MATVIYRFTAHDSDSTWDSNANYVVDGNLANYGTDNDNNSTLTLTANECTGTDLGAISKVEIRYYGALNSSTIRADITPKYGGSTLGTKQQWGATLTTTITAQAWKDITSDKGGSWTWTDVQNLDALITVNRPSSGQVRVAQVEIQVTYTANQSPTVALNSPADSSSATDTTPTLDFTGTDTESDDIRYNIQIDSVNTFDSQTGSPSVSIVQTKSGTSVGYAATVSVAMDSGFTAGNTVVIALTYNNDTTGTITGVTDGTNTFIKIADGITGADTQGELWYGYNISAVGSPTVVATNSGASHDMAMIVREYSGLTTTDPLDQTAEQASTSGTTHTSASTSTTTQADELVVAMISFGANTTFSAGTGYGNLAQQNASDIYEAVAMEDKTLSSTQTVSASFGTSSSGGGYVAVVTFKMAGASAPLLDKLSGTDSGFANPDNGGDTDPFTSGENIQFTVQGGDALSADTYYWRVRAIDPSGSNAYGDWATTRSFDVTSGSRRRIFLIS